MLSDLLFMVCFSNRLKHQFQEKSNLIPYKAPYSLLFCIVTEFKPKDRKSRTCNRKRNKKREKIKKKYQDKKKKQKSSHRTISKFEKETPQKEIWNKGLVVAKGAFGRN